MRTVTTCHKVAFSRGGKEHSRSYYNAQEQADKMVKHLRSSPGLDFVSIEHLEGDFKDGRFTPTYSVCRLIFRP